MAKLVKVAERTYYIQTGHIMDIYVGVYDLGNGKVCLIDTADGNKSAKDIDQVLMEQGWQLEFIINTHTHIDHLGGNTYLMEKWGCPAYATRLARIFAEEEYLEAACMYGGAPNKDLRHVFRHPGPIGFQDIEDFDLPDGMEWTPLPGHAFGMIGIRTSDGVWFVGDSLLSSYTLKKAPFGYLVDVDEYLFTLDKLGELDGTLFIPAHGDVVEDICPLAEANKENVHRIKDGLLKACKKGKSFDSLLKVVFDHYNIGSNMVQYAVIGMSLRCYLTSLEGQGKIGYRFTDNVLTWQTLS